MSWPLSVGLKNNSGSCAKALTVLNFFAHNGLDEFIGELALFDDADELAVVGNGSDVAFVGCEPFGSILQASADRKGFYFRVDSFADFDVESLTNGWERRGNNQGKGRFLIRFACADRALASMPCNCFNFA